MRIDRRRFLEWSSLATAGLAVGGPALARPAPGEAWNGRPERILRKYRDPVPTACAGCDARCALVAYRDGDRVVQVAPNPEAGPRAGACPRAFEALEVLYHPDRIRTPMRRKGPRGSGRWEPVSWDEAVDEVARAVTGDPGRAYVDLGRPDPPAPVLLDRLCIAHRVGPCPGGRWASREAQRAVYGAPLGQPAIRLQRTVILLGARPLDQGPYFARLARDLLAARERGARIVAVGPYQGATGSVADRWMAIRPGTETLVGLGLLRVILSQGWYDRAALEAAVDVPVADLLAALAPYPVELVEAASGLAAFDLVDLARTFAEAGPSLCLAGSGGSRSAETLEAAAALLNASQGPPEGAAGVRLDHAPSWVPRHRLTEPRARAVKDILAGNERASLYLAYRSNPVYASPRSESVRRAFQDDSRVGLVVAFATCPNETTAVADLVLPAASDLESWGLAGGYTAEGKPYAVLQQPATRARPEPVYLRGPGAVGDGVFLPPPAGPVGEARQLGDLLLDVAGVVDPSAREALPFDGVGAYVRHLADATPLLAAAGGFDALAAKGVWVGRAKRYPWAAEHGFPTGSGKLSVQGRLVHRVPRDLKRLEGDAFSLVILRYPELDPDFPGTGWGREIRHENPVYMNAGTAREMGLRRGSRVRLRTSVGEAEARVMPIQGIHPRAVALAAGFGHAEPAAGPRGAWWEPGGPGVSVPALAPFATDPFGAQAWSEIRVSVDPA